MISSCTVGFHHPYHMFIMLKFRKITDLIHVHDSYGIYSFISSSNIISSMNQLRFSNYNINHTSYIICPASYHHYIYFIFWFNHYLNIRLRAHMKTLTRITWSLFNLPKTTHYSYGLLRNFLNPQQPFNLHMKPTWKGDYNLWKLCIF